VAGRGWLGAELVSVARRTLRGVDVVRTSRLAAAAYVAGVRDTRVLKAMAVVPRSAYVPGAGASAAERDRPIAIGGGQVTTQPSLVAAMVEALDLSGDERVLEVGTGLGYQAAVLARLAREVWSVERRPELAAAAAANPRAEGIANAHVVTGDGSEGLREHAPSDAVMPRTPIARRWGHAARLTRARAQRLRTRLLVARTAAASSVSAMPEPVRARESA
jgi:protein-L-isoaspartate O-methyltransferase